MVLVFGGMGVAEHILMFQGASKAKLKYETYNQQYKILSCIFSGFVRHIFW